MSQAFTPHTIEGSRHLLETLMYSLLESAAHLETMDVVRDLA
jgi:hypothetical protein